MAVVDDQALFRQLLVTGLDAAPGISVTVAAADTASARAALLTGATGEPQGTGAGTGVGAAATATAIDVALLDVQLGDGNGIDLGLELRAANPGIGIVLLSATDSLDVLLDLPRSATHGWSYLSKTSALSLPALVRAIEVSAEGRSVFDPELVARRRPRRGSGLARLSTRQYDVLRLLAEGLSNAGIASRLGLAPRSVDNHIAGIYSELGLASGGVVNPRVAAALRFLDESAAS